MDRLKWLGLQERIEDAATPVLEEQVRSGAETTDKAERLVRDVWFANYCMTNAGDLANAMDENGAFLEEVAALALELGMVRTHAAFALPRTAFEARYDDLLEEIVIELEGVSRWIA